MRGGAGALPRDRRADRVSLALHNLATIVRESGDEARAVTLLRESLLIDHRLGRVSMVATNLWQLAGVAARAGRHEQAVRLYAAAGRLSTGAEALPAEERDATIEAARALLGAERFARAWEEGTEMTREQAVAEALAVTPPRGDGAPATPAPVSLSARAVAVGLSAREVEVLRLIAEGKSNREIGEALTISPRTAATHVANILAKLAVESRSAATAWVYLPGQPAR